MLSFFFSLTCTQVNIKKTNSPGINHFRYLIDTGYGNIDYTDVVITQLSHTINNRKPNKQQQKQKEFRSTCSRTAAVSEAFGTHRASIAETPKTYQASRIKILKVCHERELGVNPLHERGLGSQ